MSPVKASIQKTLEQKLRYRLQQLPEYVDDFIYSLANSKQLRSRIEYTKDITLFFDFLSERGYLKTTNYREVPVETLHQLRVRDIQEFLDYLTLFTKTFTDANGKERTQTYQNGIEGKRRKLASLREWYKFLVKENLVPRNLPQEIEFDSKDSHDIKDCLQPEELKHLLNVVQTHQGQRNFLPEHRQRNYLIVLILGYTGIRVGELVNLDISDIRFYDRSMILYRKGGKAQKFPLSQKLIDALETYLTYRQTVEAKDRLDKDALFLNRYGERLKTRSVNKLLEKYGQLANLPIKLTPHVLRRTFGTTHYNLNGDMDLTASLLGHASTETTRKHYAKVDAKRIRSSIENFEY